MHVPFSYFTVDKHPTKMPMWYSFLLVAHFLQPVSYFLLLRQIRSKKSVAGLSCDFTFFSWISSLASAVSGCAYTFLLTINIEYANRYPVYGELLVSWLVLVSDLVTVLVTSMMMILVFISYRKTIIGDEWISLPTKALVLGLFAFTLLLLSLYVRGRATINELDLADCVWTIGSICFGVRLVSQVTNNYFLERVFPLNRSFIIWQGTSMGLAATGLLLSRHMDVNWHQLPVNFMHQLALAPNIVVLLLLSLQGHFMGKLAHRYRTLP